MPNESPSLEAQAKRYQDLAESGEAKAIQQTLCILATYARSIGLRIEVREVSHAQAMGATHEEITVTPSRDGYQSTT